MAFLVVRYLASEWIGRKAGGRLRLLIEGVEVEGWRFVNFTRLVPLFPFNPLNYALGLTRIRLADYVLASYLRMPPMNLRLHQSRICRTCGLCRRRGIDSNGLAGARVIRGCCLPAAFRAPLQKKRARRMQ